MIGSTAYCHTAAVFSVFGMIGAAGRQNSRTHFRSGRISQAKRQRSPDYHMYPEEPAHSSSESIFLPTGRRRVLGTLGLTGLALASSATDASAFIRRSNGEPTVTVDSSSRSALAGVDTSRLPADWVRLQGRNIHSYAAFVDSLKLRTIRTQDVIAAHARQRGGVWNQIPPRQWWRRMGYTLRVVERVALEMNEPVTEIVSAYRSPSYNARCGGRRGSWHQANLALDVRLVSRPSRVTAVTRSLRDQGLFKGGVGSYRNFTHIDARGQNINW